MTRQPDSKCELAQHPELAPAHEFGPTREMAMSPAAAIQPWHVVLCCILWFVGLYFAPRVHGQEATLAPLLSEITMSDTVASTKSRDLKASALNKEVLGTAGLKRVFDRAELKSVLTSQALTTATLELAEEVGPLSDSSLIWTVDAEARLISVFLALPADSIGGVTVQGASTQRLASLESGRLLTWMSTVSKLDNVQLVRREGKLGLQSSAGSRVVDEALLRQTATRVVDAYSRLLAGNKGSTGTLQAATSKNSTPPSQATVSADTSSTSGSTPTNPDASANTASNSLVGTWSARTSATDAWAIRLEGNGSFTMVHSRGGKNTVSKGAFRVEKQQLTLSESRGLTLVGKLQQSSANAFTWTLLDQQGKPSTTLAFAKK